MFWRKRVDKLDCQIRPEKAPGCGVAVIAFEYATGERVEGAQISATPGRAGTWEIRYTAGAREIAAGGAVAIAYADGTEFRFDPNLQTGNPKGTAFMSLRAETGAELRLTGNTERPALGRAVARIAVRKGALKKGDSFALRIGDRRFGGRGVALPSLDWGETAIRIGVDPEGTGDYRELECSPLLITAVLDRQPKRYFVLTPSILRPDEPFDATVVAVDENGNVCADCNRTIRVKGPPTLGHVPGEFTFTPGDGGCRRLEGAVVDTEGRVRIEIEDAVSGIQTVGNPILCRAEGGKRIFWGDLCVHAWRRGRLDFAAGYRVARDVGRLDFCAVPACASPAGDQAGQWRAARDAARQCHKSGKFVAFPARAWQGEDWTRDVVFKSERGDGDAIGPVASAEELYRACQGKEALVIPRAGAGRGNWDRHAPEVEWLAEVTSGRGNLEWFAQEALLRGCRVGMAGSSDRRAGTPGLPRGVMTGGGGTLAERLARADSAYTCGPLTAVLAEELTRDALWDAIRRRETFATTGARILLDFRINGSPMGSEIHSDTAPKIAVDVEGTGPLLRVDIIRNQHVILSMHGEGPSLRFAHTDAYIEKGTSYYYIRVVQRDREYAWSSPIWVRNTMPDDAILDKHYPAWNTNESVVLTAVPPNGADAHYEALMEYLEAEEQAGRFHDVTPIEVVDSSMGKFALFYGYLTRPAMPVSIRLFFEFELPRVRIEPGWLDFGPTKEE